MRILVWARLYKQREERMQMKSHDINQVFNKTWMYKSVSKKKTYIASSSEKFIEKCDSFFCCSGLSMFLYL